LGDGRDLSTKIKPEPESKQERVTIRDYIGFDKEDEGTA
jgi:hypothetical protein